ncbi:MAG: hypothetical protein CMH25_03455 [Micavibrio sp.]|nr:hypothetical protein [Micavibrio sp.]|tara:strand:+ start:1154 stop:1378 length:225 start_codon:yes stop_codon:yes gene_type:complete
MSLGVGQSVTIASSDGMMGPMEMALHQAAIEHGMNAKLDADIPNATQSFGAAAQTDMSVDIGVAANSAMKLGLE